MAISNGDVVFITFIGVLLLISVVSNIMVIIVVLKSKNMRNVTNILICNLSVSDLILAGIILPQNLHDLSHEEEFHEGPVLCKVAFAFPILSITTASYTLAMMAFERRNCIVNSLRTQISTHHCKFIIPVIWGISILAASPTMIEFNVAEEVKTENNRTAIELTCKSSGMSHSYSILNGVFLLVVTYLVPLCIILYNYSRIIHFVVQHKRPIDDGSTATGASNSTLLKKRMKIIKMLIIVAALFALSWLPYFVTLISEKITGNGGSKNVGAANNLLQIFLAAFSTSYNVILYLMFNSLYRAAFKQILCGFTKNKVTAANLEPVTTKQKSYKHKRRTNASRKQVGIPESSSDTYM